MSTKVVTIREGQKCFFVGDIHGCYTELMDKLHSLKFDFSNDVLISVGDLIDRGENSLKCLQLLNEPWFHATYANHEEFAAQQALGLMSSQEQEWWETKNGGDWYFEHPDIEREKLNAQLSDLISKMTVTIKVVLPNKQTIGCLHGQMLGSDWDAMQDRLSKGDYNVVRYIIWMTDNADEVIGYKNGRNYYKPETKVSGVDAVVMGHTSVVAPMVNHNSVWIDTGYYSGLSILSADKILEIIEK